jgi:hypothetical protein
VKISLERQVDPAAWAVLAQGDADGSFFHDAAWMRALVDTYPGFSARYFLAREDNGRLAGGLPAVVARRAGLAQLLSMPFGTYAMPLVAGAPRSRGGCAVARGGGGRRPRRRGARSRCRSAPPSATGAAAAAAWRRVERTLIIPLVGFEEICSALRQGECTASRKAVRQACGAGAAPTRAPLDRLYRTQSMEWTTHATARACSSGWRSRGASGCGSGWRGTRERRSSR